VRIRNEERCDERNSIIEKAERETVDKEGQN